MTDVVQGINIKALVLVQVTKRKKEKKDSTVVEAFRHKYIKVNLDDEEDHNVLELRWNGEVYEGSFMCMTITSDYEVESNFTANKTVISSGTARENVIVKRKKSGRPVSMQT